MKTFAYTGAFEEGIDPSTKRLLYNGIDVLVTKELYDALARQLENDEPATRAYAFESRMVPALQSGNLRGMHIDQKERMRQQRYMRKAMLKIEKLMLRWVHDLISFEAWAKMAVPKIVKVGGVVWKRYERRYNDCPLSPNSNTKSAVSPQFFGKLLYDHLGAPKKKGSNKKIKGDWSVDDAALQSLLADPWLKAKKRPPQIRKLIRAVSLWTEIGKQLQYLTSPLRKNRVTYHITPGKETFRIAATKDPVTTKEGVEL